MAIIFIIMICLFVFSEQIGKWIPAFNIGTVGLISALACILTGCISYKTAIKSVDWGLAIWFCSCLGIAASVENSGGGKLLATWIVNLFGESISPFFLYVVFICLVVILTQFISNSTVLAIILPIVFSITIEMGWNTYSFAVGLTIAAAMAVATPLANTTIGMSMIAGYKFSDYLKYAGPLTVIVMVILTVLIPVLFPLTSAG